MQGEGGRGGCSKCAMFAMSAEAAREGEAAYRPHKSAPVPFVRDGHVGARVEGTAQALRLKRESMSA